MDSIKKIVHEHIVVQEKKMYVNLTDKESKTTLGAIDDKDEDYFKTIQQISNKLMQNTVGDYLDATLEKNLLPATNHDQLMNLYLNYFKGTASDFLEFERLKIFSLNYKTNKPFDLNNISGYYSRYFDQTFFDKLVQLEGLGKPIVGKGELYLAMLTHLTNTKSGEAGDLKDGSDLIEIKTAKGRFGGQAVKHNGAVALKMLLELIPELPIQNEKTFNKSVARELSAWLSNDRNKLKSNPFMKKLVKALSNYEIDYNSSMDKAFADAINGDSTGSKMASLIATIHLWGYKNHDKFKWLIFFNDKKTKIIGLDMSKNFLDTYLTMFNYLHTTIGWAGNAADASGASVSFKG